MSKVILKCSKCGIDRILTHDAAYEAKRLNKTMCRKCSGMSRKPKGSKYDSVIKKGDVFDKMVVVSERVSKSGAYVICKCECGTTAQVRVQKLLDKSIYHACRKCKTGKYSPNWKGMYDLPMSIFTKIKLRAQNRNKTFTITPEYIAELYKNQNGKCAISGLSLSFVEDGKNLADSKSVVASLDRIDSSLGYIEGNVQWVHKHINSMKNTHTTEYFIQLCNEVVKYNDTNRT
jgi:hypothetical protein